LDKVNLGASIAEALLEQDVIPLDQVTSPFEGAGVYALYFTGSFKPYHALAERNRNGRFEAPIYVGKADAEGSRKGGLGLNAAPGKTLYKRLRSDHANSIKKATNIKIKDFQCRFLVVEPVFVALGESLLIATFAPIWNKIVDGFGNHKPGAGRNKGMISRWDVLHPGRPWGKDGVPRKETRKQIAEEARNYLNTVPFPKTVKMDRSALVAEE
jgi:hypothetical protein